MPFHEDSLIGSYNNGTPEGALAAAVGHITVDLTTPGIFFKSSGTGNTGWESLVLANITTGNLQPATTPRLVDMGGRALTFNNMDLLTVTSGDEINMTASAITFAGDDGVDLASLTGVSLSGPATTITSATLSLRHSGANPDGWADGTKDGIATRIIGVGASGNVVAVDPATLGSIWTDEGTAYHPNDTTRDVWVGGNTAATATVLLDADRGDVEMDGDLLLPNTGDASLGVNLSVGRVFRNGLLYAHNEGSNCVFMGSEAGLIQTGVNVTGIGHRAGYQNNQNLLTAVGTFCAFANTGSSPTFMGNASGQNNSGNNVAGFGVSAMFSNTGNNTTALGAFCGSLNAANNLTAVGFRAGDSNTADQSTFVGVQAGQFNGTLGSTGFGYNAGTNNTGLNFTSTGVGAGQNNDQNNVAFFGTQAGITNNGANVVSVGAFAGQVNDGASCVFVGSLCGQLNTGSRAIFVGQQSGSANSGNDVIGIGHTVGMANTQSNRVIISTAALPKFANDAAADLALPPATATDTYLYIDTTTRQVKARP